MTYNPEFVNAYNDLGVIIYLERAQYEQAEELFLKGLLCNPANIELLNNLGTLYLRTHAWDKAKVRFV